MISTCPVCGATIDSLRGAMEWEQESYSGKQGAEMKVSIPFCNVGSSCNAVIAANAMDKLAEPFFAMVGRS